MELISVCEACGAEVDDTVGCGHDGDDVVVYLEPIRGEVVDAVRHVA